jgi:DNA-directed RNA polymerase specialized sigma24 family protein
MVFDEERHSIEADTDNPEAILQRSEDRDLLRQAVEALPLEFREVVVLRDLEGLSYKEIAELAGVPMGTVKSRIARGIAQLQKLLLEDAGNHAQPSPSPLKNGRGPGRRVRNSPPRDYPYFFAATLEAAA